VKRGLCTPGKPRSFILLGKIRSARVGSMCSCFNLFFETGRFQIPGGEANQFKP
jgi:hypothetical protein